MLQWQENLRDEEMPPQWMWPFDEELADHFEEVFKDRKSGGSGSRSRGLGRDDDEVQNGLASELRRDVARAAR